MYRMNNTTIKYAIQKNIDNAVQKAVQSNIKNYLTIQYPINKAIRWSIPALKGYITDALFESKDV